jgi:hypothetical protein
LLAGHEKGLCSNTYLHTIYSATANLVQSAFVCWYCFEVPEIQTQGIFGHATVMSSDKRPVAEMHAVLPQPYRTLFMIIEVSIR